ncbi:MAG: hypothetical protein LBQ98_08365 [Nitrososphaerota archaeon]|nr:hypothetical protein [Nitrososphaerota archaeon]
MVKPPFEFNKRSGVFLLIFALLFATVVAGSSVNLAGAQSHPAIKPYPTITIMSDGRVEGTDLIHRDGDVYTLTGDIFGTLKVEKDGVIIDGAGFAIRADWDGGVMLKKDPADIFMPSCYGAVVVKNVRFCDGSRIFASTQGNKFLNNTFGGGGIEIRGGNGGEGNVIKNNVFIDSNFAIFADISGVSDATENNFINCSKIYIGLYGGLVDFNRNYWSDYEILYPDAKEIEHTGIWDTPYTGEPADFGFPFVDYNPLVDPVAGAGAPEINNTPTPDSTSSTADKEPVSLLTVLIAATVVSIVVVVSIGLLVYFKRHKQTRASFLV